jgi:hypothetical protein
MKIQAWLKQWNKMQMALRFSKGHFYFDWTEIVIQ